MLFRLSLAFGCPVAELTGRISSLELTYWHAFYRMEPWGCEIEDWRTGLQAAVTANAGGGKKGGKPFKVAEFIPKRGSAKRRRAQALAESRRLMESMASGNSGNR